MFEKIRQDLFTVHGVITTLIHVCLIVGVITCWIGIQTQVLGNDPLSALQKQPVSNSSKK